MIFRTFIGDDDTAIDEKGRTAFPKGFRAQLAENERENLVVSLGPEGCLWLYVYEEYEKFMAELDERAKTSPEQAKAINMVRSQMSSTLVSLDSQNRILIPKKLLEKASLTNSVHWVPARGKILALWNPAIFDAKFGIHTEEDKKAFDAAFFGFGLTGGTGGNN